jgi:uncharacterized RDD family membrane protein YckC
VESGVAFCPACGQPALSSASGGGVAGAPAASLGSPAASYIPPSVPQYPAPVAYSHPTVLYAGFWLRVVAYLIDSLVLGLVFMAFFIPFAMMTGLVGFFGRIHPGADPQDIRNMMGGTFFLGLLVIVTLGFLGGWLYHAMMESSDWQATLGKKALNLRVTDMTGARVTFNRASGRHFGKIITGLIPFGVGFMLAGLTERKQALHDMLASCLVLRDR